MTEREPYSKSLARVRVGSVFALVVAMLAIARPTLPTVGVGFAVTALGEAIRVWAAGYLHKTVELITAGPYRHTRNPLYLGRLLIFSGITVMCGFPAAITGIALTVGYLIFFGYYLRRKELIEPERLRRRHGDRYERYYRAVPALFPRLRPFSTDQPPPIWSVERFLGNREHWMVAALVAVTLFLLWRAHLLPLALAAIGLTNR